jgi:hypothetical protein
MLRTKQREEYYEIILFSEISQHKNQRVRVIGILEIHSPISGRLFWKDQTIPIDLEFVHLENRVTEMTLYQVLGEVQENAVSGPSFR